MDIVIHHARLRGPNHNNLVSIAIQDGKIVAIGEKVPNNATTVIDAEGCLVTESFCNAHLHLCKVYTLNMMDDRALQSYHGSDMGEAMTAIELAALIKEKYSSTWILENVRKALNLALKYGTTHIRAFADVDSKAKLEGIKALLQAKKEFAGKVTLQVVAFPQDGIVREPSAEKLVEEALKLGADVVGGIPWIEYTELDEKTHIDAMFRLAEKYDRDISMLVDDAGDPGLRTLEMMAVKTIATRRFGRVLAHHARAMALYPIPYFKKVAALMNKAQMGIISDPHTGPLHARVKELIAENALVALGQDDIVDAYYPFGRNNMLEVAFLAAHLLWMTSRNELDKLYDMITLAPARCMNLQHFGIKVGNDAHLVILANQDVTQAIQYHEAPHYVISHGQVVSKNC